MTNYRLTNIDNDLWQNFKAFAALEKMTVREKLLGFINREVAVFKSERKHQGSIHDAMVKAGK